MRAVAPPPRPRRALPLTPTLPPCPAACGDLKELYRQGWEVAVHAKNHATFKKLTKEQIAEQVVGGRAALAACGIPEDSIRGHR